MAFWTRSLPLLALIAVLAPTASHAFEKEHLCGTKLVDTLLRVCRQEYRRQRNIEESLANEVEELSFQPQDMKKRKITEECCVEGCSLKKLQHYCHLWKRKLPGEARKTCCYQCSL